MNRKRFRLIIALVVLLAGYLSQVLTPAPDTDLIQATITRHIDGDTIEVNVEGKEETLRLIGIDTPEIEGPYTGAEPYGEEASRFTKELLPLGTIVYLQIDQSDRDKYERLLRYLWLSPVKDTADIDTIQNEMLNAILLREGLAEAKTYKPDIAYDQIFHTLEEDARSNGTGMHQ